MGTMHGLIEPAILGGSGPIAEELRGDVLRADLLASLEVAALVVGHHPSPKQKGQQAARRPEGGRRDQCRKVFRRVPVLEDVRAR